MNISGKELLLFRETLFCRN